MSYRVLRETPDRLTVLQDGQPVFLLAPDAQGIWAAYDCRRGSGLVPFDRGLNLDVLLGRLCSSLMAAGHLAQVQDGYVIPAPADAHDFYLSGTGFLCARQPVVRVLSQQPVPFGADPLLRAATEDERLAAGLRADEAAVFLRT